MLTRPCPSSLAEPSFFHFEPLSHCSSKLRPALRYFDSPMAVPPELPARTSAR